MTIGGTTPGYCRVTRPWAAATQLKFMVVYPLPWSLQTSAVYQNIPGMPINTTYLAVNAEIAPSLGRNLVGRNNVVIDLVPPNTIFEPRLQQVDLRMSRRSWPGRRDSGRISISTTRSTRAASSTRRPATVRSG